MRNLKKWITTALLTLLLLPAMAQQKADTTYTFRFVTDEDMFYVPWSGNGGGIEPTAFLYKTAQQWRFSTERFPSRSMVIARRSPLRPKTSPWPRRVRTA